MKNSIRNAKKKYEQKIAENSENNPRRFYSYINSKQKTRDKIGPLKIDGCLIENDAEIATELNNFFVSVFTNEDITNIDKFENLPSNLSVTLQLQI